MIGTLIARLASLNVRLAERDGRLHVDAPKGVLTPALREELAAQRDALLAHVRGSAGIPVRRRTGEGFPVSHAQSRLWVLDRLEGGSPRYNLVVATRLEGGLDVAAAQRALDIVVARHEILRTRFALVNGAVRQIPVADATVTLAVEDFTATAPAARDAVVDRVFTEESKIVFDLAALPLLRARLLRFAGDQHVLVMNLHHIVTDARSLHVLARDFEAAYAGAPLAPQPAQYGDYAAWQHDTLTDEALRHGIAFWTRELAGLPELLPLPTDVARPATLSYRGGSVPVHVAASLVAALRRLAADTGASLFMAMSAAIALVLARQSGARDIPIGVPVNSRPHPDLEDAIGLFANTVVLRCRVPAGASFRTLLGSVKQAALDAFAHQDTPFEKVVEALRLRRDLSYSPVFQVMVSFLNREAREEGTGAAGERLQMPQRHALFELDWQLHEGDEGVTGFLMYAADLFAPATAERMVRRVVRAVEAAAASPDVPVDDLDIVLEDERRLQLVEWNATAADYRGTGLVHSLVEAQARRTPDAVAVTGAGGSWTYQEVDERANAVAVELQRLGVEPGVLVGLAVERSPEMLVALLGILKAGGAYVPLDPAFPTDRLAFMATDARLALTVTGDLVERLAGRRLPSPPDVTVSAEALMYVIYTSGSTGQPKGVMLPHRAVANFLRGMAQTPGFTPADSLLAVTTLSFDIAVLELLLPLVTGGRVVIAGRDDVADPHRLVRLLEQESISVMQATPATWRMLIAAGWSGNPGLTVLCGGEALPRDLSSALLSRCAALWNMYGPTETAIWSAIHRVRRDATTAAEGVEPIGRPIANTQIYIVGDGNALLPTGAIGELCIAGDGVALGYLNQPALTAERFVANPFTTATGRRMYRTGDRARFAPDGTIEFLGRLDAQIKLRGFRIEPGEIESVLGRHPAISQCALVVHGDAADQRLVAFVVARPGATLPDDAALRDHLRRSVPEYMVPSAFVLLEQMPLTPNGKIDRRQLPSGDRLPAPEATRTAAAATPMETAVTRLWEEILHVQAPSPDANFFDLGGHSLLIVHLHQRLAAELDATFDVLDLFRHPTIRTQAALLAGTAAGTAPSDRGSRSLPSREPIAIVGMACRFPAAQDVDTYWRNLRDGVDAIRGAGVVSGLLGRRSAPREGGSRKSGYVDAHGRVDGVEYFDAEFFGIAPREAEIMDPQHRLFLECAWEAIEHAGHDPTQVGDRFGVVASAGLNTYLLRNLMPRRDIVTPENIYSLFIANDKDFLPTRVSYKLNLRGPSLNVNTACSSSLVAVHLACEMLWSGQCDAVLAGGASLQLAAQEDGYLFQPGGILSPDGRCRAFDAGASGTVPGSGVGAVVLKRLSDALAAGDTIHAVVRGSAINNDGSAKAGYTAPGVDGQAAVVREAMAAAGVTPDSIGYVEAHGTGTELGDPIEISALAQAFGAVEPRQHCRLGAVKTSIGHLDTAAGIAGLIKTALALREEAVPPTLHFHAPNPRIDFRSSPFRVSGTLEPWPRGNTPRRAGVSSFGIGGTNAHVILEEAPDQSAAPSRPEPRLFVLSARTRTALDRAIDRLAAFAAASDARPEDIAFTLAVGRASFRHAAYVVASTTAELAEALAGSRAVLAQRPETAASAASALRPGLNPTREQLAEIGRHWATGGAVDWVSLFAADRPRRIPLPTYAFERVRHWIDPEVAPRELADWFHVPGWSHAGPLLSAGPGALAGTWLVLSRGRELDRALLAGLGEAGADVTVVAPEPSSDYEGLAERLRREGRLPDRVLHAWTVNAADAGVIQELGFNSLLRLVRAFAQQGHTVREFAVLTTGVADVSGSEALVPHSSVLLAPVRVIPDEYPGTACRCIDVDDGRGELAADLLKELSRPADAQVTAWRGRHRWVPRVEPLHLPPVPAGSKPFREGGTYLITGGVGGLGLILAEHLATTARANLVLTGRRALPPPERWESGRTAGAASGVDAQLDALMPEIGVLEGRIEGELGIRPLDDRPGLLDAANSLAAAYALEYLTSQHALPPAGARWDRSRVYEACRVLPKFRRLIDHLLGNLEEQGWVRCDEGGITLLRSVFGTRPAAVLLAEACLRFPGLAPEFRMLAACAAGYPAALSGEVPAVSVLFPDGGRGIIVDAAEQTDEYSNSRVYRTLLAELLVTLASRANRRPLRILEVGGGNAIMSALVARRLAEAGVRVEYVFTDIGRTFVAAAEAKARERGYRFMSFATFDISRDPAPQGFAPGWFDAVIGLDVVHATPSIRDTAANLRGLLAEGGLLCLVESAKTYRWNDMAWGLAEGWWMYGDAELRNPNSPLLGTAAWETALEPCGFSSVAAFPRSADARARTMCSLVVAQSGVAARSVARDVDGDAATLAALARIRRHAGGLMVRQADVADHAAMTKLVDEAEARFGRIDGVIHAAAVEHKALIASREPRVEEREFRPKVDGTLVLDRIFRDRRLDFMVLYSSITAEIGGGGQVGYCGANAFLDAFASERARAGDRLTVSINWGRWQGAGLAQEFEAWHQARTGEMLTGGMTADEGIEALRRILHHRIGPRVAVVSSDWRSERQVPRGADASEPVPVVFSGTDIEQQLAAIWRQLLGAAAFDRDTPFQDVGGDSLVGIQLVARIREQLGVQLPIQVVFDCPTIARLAVRILEMAGTEIEEGAL